MTSAANDDRALDLAKPLHIRAEMARRGLLFSHLLPYEDAGRGWVDPLDDDETRGAVRGFMGQLWLACVRAERPPHGSDGADQ